MGKEKLSLAHVTLFAALALSGCAATVHGTAAGGVVQAGLLQSEAFKAANAHCDKFGKIVRITQTSILQDSMTFDCVAP